MELSAFSIVRIDEGREFIYRNLRRKACRAFNKQFIRSMKELSKLALAVWRDTFPSYFKLSDYQMTDETRVLLEEAIQRGHVDMAFPYTDDVYPPALSAADFV